MVPFQAEGRIGRTWAVACAQSPPHRWPAQLVPAWVFLAETIRWGIGGDCFRFRARFGL